MSIRSLIEINHDFAFPTDSDFIPLLQRYLRSGDREDAERLEHFGVRVIGMRHHSGKYILAATPDGFPPQYLEPKGSKP